MAAAGAAGVVDDDADDVAVVEVLVDSSAAARVRVHVLLGRVRRACRAELGPLWRPLDRLARDAVRDCMQFARALRDLDAALHARRDADDRLPRRVPGAPRWLDAHVLYLDCLADFMFVPGALCRLLAAWGVRDPPACACGPDAWQVSPTPPRLSTRRRGGRLVADERGEITLFCWRCLARSPPSPWRW